MLLDKQPLTRAELGTDDLGALGGGCQGHCQSCGGNLDKEEAGPPDSGVRVDDGRLPFGGKLGDNN